MKMGDGGFRQAFNVQFATTCQDQVIVGMEVVNAGSDMAQLAPMLGQVEPRLGRSPQAWLVDGGFPAHEQIEEVQPGKHRPGPDDSDAVARWRVRMASEEARDIYKQRARRRPNASTRRPATGACCACRWAACPRCVVWRACSCWRTTCYARRCSRRSSLVGGQVRLQSRRRPHERARNEPKALSKPLDREPGTNQGPRVRNSTPRAGDHVKHRQQSRQCRQPKNSQLLRPTPIRWLLCFAGRR